MKRYVAKRVFLFILIAPLAIAVIGFVVTHLWNWLAAAVFGWHLITFWQAVGILILARILFGRMRGPGGPGMFWRHRMMERWEKMTPEEREKFRQSWSARCGGFGVPGSETKGPT